MFCPIHWAHIKRLIPMVENPQDALKSSLWNLGGLQNLVWHSKKVDVSFDKVRVHIFGDFRENTFYAPSSHLSTY